jgi:hypothetical protein
MTEPLSGESGRLDLRALSLPGDESAEASIATVMSRVAAAQSIVPLERFRRFMLAAAVILVAVALGTLRFTDGNRLAADGRDLLATWVESGHVPTNGELLAAYQGYTP